MRSLSLRLRLALAVLGLLILAAPFAANLWSAAAVRDGDQTVATLRDGTRRVLQACEAHLKAARLPGHVVLPPDNGSVPSGYASRLTTGGPSRWRVGGEWQGKSGRRFFTCEATEDGRAIRVDRVSWD